jgi:predicted ATPase/DNA-binding winged helix-turn-helix (wHTH) protein
VHAPIRFGAVEVRPAERAVLLDGQPAALGARAFDLLLALIEQRERVVPKSELFDRVWPGLVVEENNLQVQISALRKLLGPQVIATVPGRGYRFSAALDAGAHDSANAADRDPVRAAEQPAAAATSPTNLPGDLPPLYGRDADLQALRSLIDGHKLVTVVGAGGIGKSRLAQTAAHALAGRWPDGAWMVELAGLSDPTLVPNAAAQALRIGLPGQGAAQDELVAALAQRRLLLVLDNCEHLLDATAALVQAMASGAPHVTVLTTSQEPLHLQGEQQFRVMPLAVPSEAAADGAQEFGAVALFQARVRAAEPRFSLNEECLGLVIDICRRLDGLPLAIELAAARVATLGLRPVHDKLDARFKLLTGGARATLRRHQTLRAALEWSHNLLNDSERAVFRRLGVFAGGFTMELAQAVAGDAGLDEWAVLDLLSALVDKSLVVVDAGEAPRYRLLESARAFALEQLAAAGETAEVLGRHAHAVLAFLKGIDDRNMDGELRTDQYAAAVLPELDNIRAAHAWATGETGDGEVAIGLAAHSGSLVDYVIECADWIVRLRGQAEGSALKPALAARYWRAVAAGNMGGLVSLAEQAEAAARAASLYRSLGQPRRVFSSLMRLGQYRDAQGRVDDSRAALGEARGLIEPDWPPEFRIMLLRRDASLARQAGRAAEALALGREAVRLSAATGDWRLEVIDRNILVDLAWEVAPIEEAEREASSLVNDLRARPAPAGDMDLVFGNLVGILSEMGRVAEAVNVAREAWPLMCRTQRYCIEEWAHLFWRMGQVETAARLLGASDARVARADSPLQPNERRLIAEVRAALVAALPAEAFTRLVAGGAALSDGGIVALISAALGQH